jgi:hypothetical protein
MCLLGKWNWYLPHPFERLLRVRAARAPEAPPASETA